MYYLNGAYSVIQYNDINISRLCNYNNWSQLSTDEVRLLIVHCSTFSPDSLNNRLFFNFDAFYGNSSKKFFEISQVSDRLLIVQSIVVTAKTCRVNDIMTCKTSWMQNNYLNQIRNPTQQLNNSSPRPHERRCVLL